MWRQTAVGRISHERRVIYKTEQFQAVHGMSPVASERSGNKVYTISFPIAAQQKSTPFLEVKPCTKPNFQE